MRQQIPLPTQGLSDNEAAADQPLGTTSEAVNVRGLDPKTGRKRISQRAGSSKLTDSQVTTTGKVDEVVAVTYDETRLSYEELTGSSFTTEWSATPTPGGFVVDQDTDRQGNVYALTTDGTVTKYNSEGVRVDTITIPAPALFLIVPRIVVDEVDHVIVAATKDSGSSDRGRVWKFRPRERPDGATVYEAAWELATAHSIESFDVRAGKLVLLGSGSADDEGAYSLSAYSGTFGAFPLLSWSRAAPDPSNGVVISGTGDVFVTSEPNENRAQTGTGGDWNASSVAWSPHEEFQSETRMRSWVDARQIVGLVHGDRVSQWEDRRYIATEEDNPASPTNHLSTGQPGAADPDNANAHAPEPTDNLVNRDLYQPEGDVGSGVYLNAPKYNSGVIGEWASVAFDASEASPEGQGTGYGGNALRSRVGPGPFNFWKSDTDSDGFPDSDGSNISDRPLLPNHVPWIDGDPRGNGFTFCLAGVLPEDPSPQVLWASLTFTATDVRYAVVYNAEYDTGSNQWSEVAGSICFYVEDGQEAGSIFKSINCPESEWKQEGATGGDTTGNDKRFVCITFCHGGSESPFVAPTGDYDNHTTFRINGRHMGRMTLYGQNYSNQGTAFTVYGGYRFSNSEGGNLFPTDTNPDGLTSPFTNFNGHLCEGLVFYHHDDSGENDGDTMTDFDTGWGPVQPNDGAGTPLPPTSQGDVSGSLDTTTYAGNEAAYTDSATTVERLEGYACHRWGSAEVLPDTTGGSAPFYNAHPFGGARVPTGTASGYNGIAIQTGDALNSVNAVLAKFSGANGSVIWALNGSGVGYGVAVGDDGNPMTVGPLQSPSTTSARKVIDEGADYSTDSLDGAWEVSLTAQSYRSPRLRTDSYGDLYWPRVTASDTNDILKLSKVDGSTLWTFSFDNGSQVSQAVAFPPTLPVYNDDSITGPEFMYASSSDGGTTSVPLLYKILLVSSSLNVSEGQSLRRHAVVTIGQGDIKLISGSTLSTPTGGTGALNADSPYIQAVQLFGQVFITDGESYYVLDPKESTVEPFVPLDGGELPKRARILTAWRGRLIATRAADDPYEIYASELGNPYNWDIYPAALSTAQAWSGRAGGVGRAPDIVTCFAPITDDVAIIGCDHSIYRMTGDPAAGGDVELVTDQVGIAYGNSWTKDPFGRLYFFSSRGGVYVLNPQGGYDRVSVDRIERRLQAVDLLEYDIRLAWDYRREGLIVWPVPKVLGGVAHRGWFFEAKTGAWWEDDWQGTGVQPSCVTIFDGDEPNDRKVIFGCEDGYVRIIDEDAVNDDGTRIDARVMAGPLVPSGTGTEFIFSRPQIVLASDQNGVDVEFLASNVADDEGTWWARRRVSSGRSQFLPERTRGAAVWFRVRNDRLDERFSIEDATVEVAPAGMSVVR